MGESIIIERKPDIEVCFTNIRRKGGDCSLYLIDNGYLANGFHQYYDKVELPNSTEAYGTITFTEPEAHPHCLWVGKTINIQKGNRLVGHATVKQIFNPILESQSLKFNTHEKTPRPKDSKLTKTLLSLVYILPGIIFLLASFCCFYYAHSIVGGICILLLYIVLYGLFTVLVSDLYKAHVEIIGNKIHIVDYYFGFKKEKFFTFDDIAFGTFDSGVRGVRDRRCCYLVFKDHKRKYLFKIICLPETAAIFEKYIDNKHLLKNYFDNKHLLK